MRISASVQNAFGEHVVTLRTDDTTHQVAIPPKRDGFGSSVNGGELLFLALATCYCNDLYREANKRGIEVRRVEIEAEGTFGGEGLPAEQISYQARVWARAPEQQILQLMRQTDAVAEIQNTLRRASRIRLTEVEAHETT